MKVYTDHYLGRKTLSFSFWRLRGHFTWVGAPGKTVKQRVDAVCWKCVGWRCKLRPYFCWLKGHDWVNQVEDWDGYLSGWSDKATCRWCGHGRKGS